MTNLKKAQLISTDDDYLPFVNAPTTATAGGSGVSLAAQMHRLPPPPKHMEPEIVLTGKGREAKLAGATKDRLVAQVESRKDDSCGTPDDFMPTKKKRVWDFGLEKVVKERALASGEREETPAAEAKTSWADSRKNKWELPLISDTISLPTTDTRLQRHIKATGTREAGAWRVQKAVLAKKFGPEGWAPLKKLSPEAIDGIRTLHAHHPDRFRTGELAKLFEVSAEAIRRVLRSKWRPTAEEQIDRMERWERRGRVIFNTKVELGEVKTKSMKKKERKARERTRDQKFSGSLMDRGAFSDRIL